jgi:murein DD-endopeptidase MepM/ murein hydrolase activator NlpD
MRKDCMVQNYFDHGSASGARDYTCGYLTYPTHTGTDFRVKDHEAMRRGVEVIAAADGVVRAVRDGEDDIPISLKGVSNLHGKDAGNAVVLVHADGMETQYSHLRKHSVAVRVGQSVSKGDKLGLVGESGRADFPHVDFSVRVKNQAVDPFSAQTNSHECSQVSSRFSIWSSEAKEKLAYQSTGILTLGWADKVPSRLEIDAANFDRQLLNDTSAHIVAWAELWGVQTNDEWLVQVWDPDGKLIMTGGKKFSGNQAIAVVAIDKLRGLISWPSGPYLMLVQVRRGASIIAVGRDTLDLKQGGNP